MSDAATDASCSGYIVRVGLAEPLVRRAGSVERSAPPRTRG